MDQITVILPKSQKEAIVSIVKKNIKTCRLKVYPNLDVCISVPEKMSSDDVYYFLNQKSWWIEEKLEVFRSTAGYSSTTEIRDGFSIRMFGEDLIFSVSTGIKNSIFREGKTIKISNINPNDQSGVMKQFETWWRKESINFLNERVRKYYPIIQKYGRCFPKIQIRRMKTLWGSCNVNRNVITFNQYLIKAKPACVDYVVLHELAHFIYPNHSKQFYDFLSIYMPDWKDRKKTLDQEVVHGL